MKGIKYAMSFLLGMWLAVCSYDAFVLRLFAGGGSDATMAMRAAIEIASLILGGAYVICKFIGWVLDNWDDME